MIYTLEEVLMYLFYALGIYWFVYQHTTDEKLTSAEVLK